MRFPFDSINQAPLRRSHVALGSSIDPIWWSAKGPNQDGHSAEVPEAPGFAQHEDHAGAKQFHV